MIAVVTSGKGGVGKSTVCVGLALALAERGQRVLVIDTDAGLRSLDLMMGIAESAVYDLGDIFRRECDPQSTICPSPLHPNVFVIPAPNAPEDLCSPAEMTYLCRGLAAHFDTVLIDCPAGLGRGFQTAVAAADRAILVATPDEVCARDAFYTANRLDTLDISYKMIINRMRPKAVKRGAMLDIDEVMDLAQVPLLGVLPDEEAITLATSKGTGIPKKSYCTQCFRNIAARFCGESIPLARVDKMT